MDRNEPIASPTTRQSSLSMMMSSRHGRAGVLVRRFGEAVAAVGGTEIIVLAAVHERQRAVRVHLHAADRIAYFAACRRLTAAMSAVSSVAAMPARHVRAATVTHHREKQPAPEQKPSDVLQGIQIHDVTSFQPFAPESPCGSIKRAEHEAGSGEQHKPGNESREAARDRPGAGWR